MTDFERLMEEHDRLHHLAEKLVEITGRDDRDVDAVLLVRTDLAAELVTHLAQEDSFIYPRLIAGDDHAISHVALAFVAEFDDLAACWEEYLQSWTREAILVDWPFFQIQTRHIMDRLCTRIRRENDLLYPMALRGGVIRLRTPPSPSPLAA